MLLSSPSAPPAFVVAPVPPTLLAHLATVPDPRIERTRRHTLVDILAITLLATLCGADAYTEIAQYGRTHEAWLKSFLQLPNGIPSHDTFERVLGRLDRHGFERCFAEWASAVAVLATGEVIAIDGKTARRSRDASHHPLHAVSAWATRQQLVLGQVRTEEKSNEITAIPELLKLLDIKGCTVTIDAMGCQKEITSAIRAKRADYLLTVKGNQTWLHERVDHFFTNFLEHSGEPIWRYVSRETVTTVEKDHGRIEKRHYTVVPAERVLTDRSGWMDLRSICCVVSERTLLTGPSAGVTTRERRYFITSLPPKVNPVAHAIRSHWGIENSCHWTLDVVFGEDQSRVRRGHGPANLATIRRWALSLLKQDHTHPHGLKARRLQAAWDPDYLLRVLRFANHAHQSS